MHYVEGLQLLAREVVMTKVLLPELGEGIENGTVSYWYFKEGEKVNEGEDLVEVTTDKSTFNVPAPCQGTLSNILIKEGNTVKVGEALGIIEDNQ